MSIISTERVCRGKTCTEKIRYILMPSGKQMPVNAYPTIAFIVNEPSEDNTVSNADIVKTRTVWVPHWISCTDSDKFRKPRKDKQMKLHMEA